MPAIHMPIDNYFVLYAPLVDGPVYISCRSASQTVGYCYFYDDSRMPAANFLVGPSSLPAMAFKRSQFQDILTLLREEKPIYYSFATETMKGSLQTATEPVGEDEGP